jgi:hypothetical protein
VSGALTAGFDMSIEISEEQLGPALAELLASPIPSLSFQLPGGARGSLTLFGQSIYAKASLPSPSIYVTMVFGDAALQLTYEEGGATHWPRHLTAPTTGHASPLSGTLTAGPIGLVVEAVPGAPAPTPTPAPGEPPSLPQQQVGFTVPDQIQVTLDFDDGGSLQSVEGLLTSAGATLAQLQAVVAAFVSPPYLRLLVSQITSSPLTFNMAESNVGALVPSGPNPAPTPNFLDVALATVPATAGRTGVLCVLGTLLPDTAPANPADKTVSALVPPNRVAIGLSPAATREFNICPAVPPAIGVLDPYVDDWPAEYWWLGQTLPPTCGTAAGVRVPVPHVTVDLRYLTFQFLDGAIRISGMGTGHRTGGHGTFSFDLELQLDVVGEQIDVTGTLLDVHVSVELDWWVALLLGLGIPFFGGVFTAEGLQNIFIGEVTSQLVSRFKAGLKSLEVAYNPVFSGFVLTSADIYADGVLIQGLIPTGSEPQPPLEPQVNVMQTSSAVVTTQPLQTIHAPANDCVTMPYTYTVVAQNLELTLTAVTDNLAAPISYSWTVGGQALDASSGFLWPGQATALYYVLGTDGSSATLANVRLTENFGVYVSCQAIDSLGVEATSPPTLFQFQVITADYPPGIMNQLANCWSQLAAQIGEGIVSGPLPQPPATPDPGDIDFGDLVGMAVSAAAQGLTVPWLQGATYGAGQLAGAADTGGALEP